MAAISKLVAEVHMDHSDFDKGSRHVQKEIGGLKKMFGGAGSVAGGFIIGNIAMQAGGQVRDAFTGMISDASDLNESLSKTQVVFGDFAGGVIDWSEQTAQTLGISQNEALATASTFGNLFAGMGVGQKEAAGMSQDMVQLAADLSSFNNIPVDQVLEDLRSGLVGEAEPMRKYGVLLDEATVAQKAMEMTGKDNAKMLTQQEKLLARQALMFEQTTSAQGDFARTSGGLANQMRILRARLADFSAHLGQKLLPIVMKAIDAINHFIESFRRARARGLNPFEAAMKALRSTIMKLIGRDAFRGLRDAFVDLENIIARVAGIIKSVFVAAFDAMRSHMNLVGPAIKGLGIALLVVLPILGALAIAFGILTSPIFLIIAAVVALTIAWETNFLNIQGITAAVVGFLLPLLQQFAAWFTGTAVPAIAAFAGAVAGFITGTVVPALSAFWATVGPYLAQFSDWLLNVAVPAIADFERAVAEKIGSAIHWLKVMWPEVQPALQAVAAIIGRVGERVIDLAGDVARNVDTVIQWLTRIYHWSKEAIDLAIGKIGAIKDAALDVATWVSVHIQNVVDVISGLADLITGPIDAVVEQFDRIKGAVEGIWDKTIGNLSSGRVMGEIAEAMGGTAGQQAGGVGGPEISVTVTADISDFNTQIKSVNESLLAFQTTTWVTNLDAKDSAFEDQLKASRVAARDQWASEIWPTTLDADAGEFYSALSGVRDAASTFAGNVYTTTIDANIQPALDALALLDQYLPHSPAKRGPLARVPSFDYVADSFKRAMGTITGGMGSVSIRGSTGGGLSVTVYGDLHVPAGYPDFASAMGAWSRGEAS